MLCTLHNVAVSAHLKNCLDVVPIALASSVVPDHKNKF